MSGHREEFLRALLAREPFGDVTICGGRAARRFAVLEDGHDEGVKLRAVRRSNSLELQQEIASTAKYGREVEEY